ncbi:hypothetical protein THIOM_000168 [Candidatus Thiomargarita nelsonii]|uniref:Uncharacterized protein n=1 Tax=Candidatus Thiomargarita nelsonii TaxID=1003181 RepID=A0A176S7I3_9GAMM|nr:hypothetical protein THIOM_000168 [Candidatus Thiomargarita nelsonii]
MTKVQIVPVLSITVNINLIEGIGETKSHFATIHLADKLIGFATRHRKHDIQILGISRIINFVTLFDTILVRQKIAFQIHPDGINGEIAHFPNLSSSLATSRRTAGTTNWSFIMTSVLPVAVAPSLATSPLGLTAKNLNLGAM